MRPLDISTSTEPNSAAKAEGRADAMLAAGDAANGASPINGRRTSSLLRAFLQVQTEPRVTVGALRDALEDRGFGVLLFIFALPNLVPLNIPLLSAVLGVPLVLLGAQLAYGAHKPWFPDWLAERSFPREGFASVVHRALPYLERIERLLRPRLPALTTWTGERLVGAAVLVLAVVLTLPILFGNWLPSFAIAVIGLAIVEKDGLAIIIGLIFGAIGLGIAGAVVFGFLKALLLLISAVPI